MDSYVRDCVAEGWCVQTAGFLTGKKLQITPTLGSLWSQRHWESPTTHTHTHLQACWLIRLQMSACNRSNVFTKDNDSLHLILTGQGLWEMGETSNNIIVIMVVGLFGCHVVPGSIAEHHSLLILLTLNRPAARFLARLIWSGPQPLVWFNLVCSSLELTWLTQDHKKCTDLKTHLLQWSGRLSGGDYSITVFHGSGVL